MSWIELTAVDGKEHNILLVQTEHIVSVVSATKGARLSFIDGTSQLVFESLDEVKSQLFGLSIVKPPAFGAVNVKITRPELKNKTSIGLG